MKRSNFATLIGAGAVAAGLALSPFGAAAQAEDNAPDRDGYTECVEQQPDGDDGRKDDYAIQTCCVFYNGTVEEDVADPSGQTHWCDIPAVEAVEQSSPTPTKPPVRPGTEVAPLEPSVLEPAAPTGTFRPPRVLAPLVLAPANGLF